jgi:ubiquinone/menaquinone biosynthesis C-methylase UbiE
MNISARAFTSATATVMPDLTAMKARQQMAWSSGDYGLIGMTLNIVGETLCEALDLRGGQSVLDVAAGNGNISLAAARRWCKVTSTDYVPSLLERGKARAEADGLAIAFEEADAEDLQFVDNSFDAVVSTFGVMFTPNQDKAAAEMARVCKHGGKIGMANWTPDGFIGQLFKTLGKYLPPPAGAKSPAQWGTKTRLTELFEPATASIEAEPRMFNFRYRAQGLCRARPARAEGPAQRHDRADRAPERGRRRHHGGAGAVSRSGDREAVMQPHQE